jgi:hypothetical protein
VVPKIKLDDDDVVGGASVPAVGGRKFVLVGGLLFVDVLEPSGDGGIASEADI